MFKRFLAEKGWILIIGILICAGAITFTYFRFRNAEKDLADYRLAISCPSQDNCRQKIAATVLESHGVSVFVKGVQTKNGSTPSLRDTTYSITVSSILGKSEIRISANPPTNGTPFDIGNIHIPTGRDTLFVEENFSKGQIVYIETWHGRITLLYLDTITDIPDYVIPPTPVPGLSPILTSIPSPKTYEIALPTTIHPILRQAGAQYNFFYTTLFGFLLMLILISNSHKELDKIWQEVFKRKTKSNSSLQKQSHIK